MEGHVSVVLEVYNMELYLEYIYFNNYGTVDSIFNKNFVINRKRGVTLARSP